MHVVVNSRKPSQRLQELEVYSSSVTRCSETGRQAGPAAQGSNQRPDASLPSCFAVLNICLSCWLSCGCCTFRHHFRVTGRRQGKKPRVLSPREALVLHSGKGISRIFSLVLVRTSSYFLVSTGRILGIE